MYQFYNYEELFKPEEVIDYLRKSRTDDANLTVEEVLEKIYYKNILRFCGDPK